MFLFLYLPWFWYKEGVGLLQVAGLSCACWWICWCCCWWCWNEYVKCRLICRPKSAGDAVEFGGDWWAKQNTKINLICLNSEIKVQLTLEAFSKWRFYHAVPSYFPCADVSFVSPSSFGTRLGSPSCSARSRGLFFPDPDRQDCYRVESWPGEQTVAPLWRLSLPFWLYFHLYGRFRSRRLLQKFQFIVSELKFLFVAKEQAQNLGNLRKVWNFQKALKNREKGWSFEKVPRIFLTASVLKF